MRISFFKSILTVLLALSFWTPTAFSQNQFSVEPELQGRVEFWKLIFTKYGKQDIVFHHREYPEIIYSVLDFREFADKYSGRRFEKEKRKVLKEEERNIRSALKNLSKGLTPSNSFERRVQTLFRKYNISTKRHYKLAANLKNIRWQTGIRERFEKGLIRSGRYLEAIEQVFLQAGLPPELGRLPLVESSFDYKAYSSVGAAGIWQFMRATGRQFLTISAAIDDRRDPIAATRAAARYLGNAHRKLGSWPLAITSYNHGVSGILRAVKQVGSRKLGRIVREYESKTFGFASGNFYAEFIAALEIEQDSKSYFPELVRESPLRFDEVELGAAIKFRNALNFSGLSAEEFQALNLGLRSPITKGRVRIPKGYIIKVPRGKGGNVVASVKNSRQLTISSGTKEYLANKPKRLKFEYAGSRYRVRPGDNLGAIARRYRISRRDLMAANNIRNANRIRIGQRLIIPGRGESRVAKKAKKKKQARSSGTGSYVVKSGDTIGKIANRFSVSQQALMNANGIADPKRLFVGKKLKIPGAKVVSAARKASSFSYRVRSGDNLSIIAKRHGITLSELRKLNPGVKDGIRPGQKISVSK